MRAVLDVLVREMGIVMSFKVSEINWLREEGCSGAHKGNRGTENQEH